MQMLSCPDSMSSHVSKVILHNGACTHHALSTCMHSHECTHAMYNDAPLLHHDDSNTDWIIRSVAIATISFIGYSYTSRDIHNYS